MTIKLFNTLGRKIEVFEPQNPPLVNLYTCGPTVYSTAHLGNLRSFLFADILCRVLTWAGFKVQQIMNITDVGHLTDDASDGEDKMERAATAQQTSVWELSEQYTSLFKEHLRELNIHEPQTWMKATETIADQIALIQTLEKKGWTYATRDGIYFDTSKFPRYAELALLNLDQLQEGARVAENPERRNPSDFALWKFSPTDQRRQMEWDSPWGMGFPGWHIECSAMAMKAFGPSLDIHTGGTDHIPVHHTNEIAQSEAATGQRFVRYWLHGAFLVLNEGRMGKSEGNAITLETVKERGFSPLVFRYYLLQTHYRKILRFSWEAMSAAKEGMARLRDFADRVQQLHHNVPKNGRTNHSLQALLDDLRHAFEEAVSDDLNMPEALAAVHTFITNCYKLLEKSPWAQSDTQAIIEQFRGLDRVLGLDLLEGKVIEQIPDDIQALVLEREEARRARDFHRADLLRSQIEQQGFLVEDQPKGSRLKKV